MSHVLNFSNTVSRLNLLAIQCLYIYVASKHHSPEPAAILTLCCIHIKTNKLPD